MDRIRASIVVDAKQRLSGQLGNDLVAEIGRLPGVSSAAVSVPVPRVVLVRYDPNQVKAQRILGIAVRRGFDAHLVGL